MWCDGEGDIQVQYAIPTPHEAGHITFAHERDQGAISPARAPPMSRPSPGTLWPFLGRRGSVPPDPPQRKAEVGGAWKHAQSQHRNLHDFRTWFHVEEPLVQHTPPPSPHVPDISRIPPPPLPPRARYFPIVPSARLVLTVAPGP